MHLKQPGFTYRACGPFTREQKIHKFMQTRDTRYTYRKDLDKTCFQHDMATRSYKDLVKRIESDSVLRDKAFVGLALKGLKLLVIQNMTVMKED